MQTPRPTRKLPPAFKDPVDVSATTDKYGIVSAVNPAYVRDKNLKYMKMYDWMSYGYDIVERLVGGWKYGKAIQEVRRNLMRTLEWEPGARVLYVSIGTGTDLKYLPEGIDLQTLEIFGADVSHGMLRKCRRNYKDLATKLTLVHACAEDLPFNDGAFDTVFHVGGINFFSDKARAVHEMLRVAKPGSKLMIADETSDYINSEYKQSSFARKYFADAKFDLSELEAAIPPSVKNLEMQSLWDNKFYCLTFRKPKGKRATKRPAQRKFRR